MTLDSTADVLSIGLTMVPVATFTYIGDCYLPVNADALLLINGLKVSSNDRALVVTS
jgi:hypothetical protein